VSEAPILQRRIFRGYPAGKLPADLRGSIDPDAWVNVTVETQAELVPGMLIEEWVYEYRNGELVKLEERTHTAP
jgi:hypothetical protein